MHVCVTFVYSKLTFISSSYIDSDHLNQILPLHHAHCTFEQHDQGLGRQDTREGGERSEGKLTQCVSTHLHSVFSSTVHADLSFEVRLLSRGRNHTCHPHHWLPVQRVREDRSPRLEGEVEEVEEQQTLNH